MKNSDSDLESDRISVLEKILLTSESEAEKIEAIVQLKGKSDDRAQLAIVRSLNDKSWRVRELAILNVSSSRVSDEILAPNLIKLLDDESPKIREKAIQLLKEIAKEEFLPYFLNKLNDNSDLVRAMAIQAIGDIGHKGIYESLITQFNSESSTLTKRASLQVIAKKRDETTVDFLIEVLQNESEAVEIRSDAALLLAKSGSMKAFILITSLIDSTISIQLKLGLIKSLAAIHEEKTVDFLTELCTGELKEQEFQNSMKVALLNPLDYRFKDLDDSAKVILTTIKILGLYCHKKALPYLLHTLDSVYTLIRLQSAVALFQFNDISINERLLSILRDKNEENQFIEILFEAMYKINKENYTNLGLSTDRMFSRYRKFIDEFFI